MDEKKSNVAASSIIDLKAELYRKQQEFNQQKLTSNKDGYVRPKPAEKKPNIWSKKNAGVLQRSQRDLEAKKEEEDDYEKSRKALEAKTRLYEEITQGKEIPDEDGSKIFLVDFQKKVIDDIVERREKERKEEEERLERAEEEILARVDVPPPANEGEEWVDFKDSLGRSRRCMKKDLPLLQHRDRQLQNKTTPDEDTRSPQLLSNDMRREMLRQKWEEEEKAAMNQPIHYANVQFDEIRTHGVGFYQFAKDESIRQEQQQTLSNIRQKTKEERDRKDRIKEKRKAIMEARLAKVKQRKMQREGGGMFGSDFHQVEKEEEEEEEEVIGPKISEKSEKAEDKSTIKKEPEMLTRDETIKKNAPIREWDKGKEKLLFPATSEERYLDERRSERLQEFAPPSFYYDSVPSKTPEGKQNNSKDNLPSDHSDKQNNPKRGVAGRYTAEGLQETLLRSFQSKTDMGPSAKKMQKTEYNAEQQELSTPESQNVEDIPLPPTSNNSASTVENQHNAWTDVSQDTTNQPFAELYGMGYNTSYVENIASNYGTQPENYYYPYGYTWQTDMRGHQGEALHPSVSESQYPSWSSQPDMNMQQNVQGFTPSTTSQQQTPGAGQEEVLSAVVTNEKEEHKPPPVKYNIVDPRFVQNQEVWESELPNLTVTKSETNVEEGGIEEPPGLK